MKRRYDVVVIGAGPVGSFTAYQLAERGLKVCLIDKKERIGEDSICAGVIGREAFERYDLPADTVLSSINSVSFFSPFGQRLEYEQKNFFAYVVDRDLFDRKLFLRAKKRGVEIFLGQRVSDISGAPYFYTVKSNRQTHNTKAVVVATGIDCRLHEKVGLKPPPQYLYGSQIEIAVPHSPTKLEIHIGRDFAPGSFGWLIPFRKGHAKIGVLLPQTSKKWLKKFVQQRLGINHGFDEKNIRIKAIAYGPVDKSVNGNILLVGEAAGQVKTTTGGGIFYGLLCSEIAVDNLVRTLKDGYGLSEYDITWRSALASELDIGRNLRLIAAKLDDQKVENLFSFVKQNRFWVELLVPRIDFDYHSNVIFFCMKSFGQLLRLGD
ncbi:MAG: NAD(P)/FAD-dependent oxidoreductase [candidate division WOR-3 bacterium]|nr:MAG: NAD(P)/FAD-dependent oxidoreductase [candidate division WOR-3 bacterium]